MYNIIEVSLEKTKASNINIHKKQKNPHQKDVSKIGSPSWTRTNDPAVNSRMLYRLSY